MSQFNFTRKSISRYLLLVISSFLISAVVSVSFHPLDNQAVAKEITLGYSNSPSWWAWAIAEDFGLFEANDLNVKLKWYDNYSSSVADFDRGALDANSEIVVNAKELGTTAILNSYSQGEDQLIVKPGINNLPDLKGKTIVAESNEILDILIPQKSLREEINVLNLEAGLASAAFVTDSNIDGVLSYPPYSNIALQSKGARAISSSAIFPGEISRMLVIQEELAERSPETIKKLQASWFEALDFIKNNPKIAQTIIANKLDLELAQVRKIQPQIHLASKEENSLILAKNHDN